MGGYFLKADGDSPSVALRGPRIGYGVDFSRSHATGTVASSPYPDPKDGGAADAAATEAIGTGKTHGRDACVPLLPGGAGDPRSARTGREGKGVLGVLRVPGPRSALPTKWKEGRREGQRKGQGPFPET